MPTPPDIAIEVFGKTDVGLIREHNEDNFLVADVTGSVRAADGRPPFTFKLGDKGALLLVCDGMGGAAAGEVAAQMAADAIYEALTHADAQPRDGFARLLRRAVQRANERIFIQSRDNQSERGMGTTCTAAGLVDDTLVIAQIGDSRCYVLRDGKLAQVTKDQSLAWQLIEAGAMTPEEAKAFEHANIILQALGVQEHVEVVLSQVQLRKGDVALLCSDGLHGPVTDEEILSVMVTEPDLQKAGEALIQKALDRDGPDNITVALARFEGGALKPPAPEDAISFLGYDPGSDPVPELMGTLDDSSIGSETVEERLPTGLLGAEDDVPTKTDAATDPGVSGGPGRPGGLRARRADTAPAPRGVPSLLALFLIGLVAAATGGIFVMKCERDQSARSDGRVTLP
ncbi:MAG TPA: protein phosphatase 2C domain-containing protein [Polyangia bacterium]|jgi:serine/threonine protein phosphatase PrpC|nr:protein phosphatase 2C domain-containing protein [Polyangia bacterium]